MQFDIEEFYPSISNFKETITESYNIGENFSKYKW